MMNCSPLAFRPPNRTVLIKCLVGTPLVVVSEEFLHFSMVPFDVCTWFCVNYPSHAVLTVFYIVLS